jgi:hypothetical protein
MDDIGIELQTGGFDDFKFEDLVLEGFLEIVFDVDEVFFFDLFQFLDVGTLRVLTLEGLGYPVYCSLFEGYAFWVMEECTTVIVLLYYLEMSEC